MRYRMLVAELVGETATVVMDAIGGRVPRRRGRLDGDRLLVEHGLGGDPHLVTHLAELIADHPTGRHRRTR
jgi:hypothetical protein